LVFYDTMIAHFSNMHWSLKHKSKIHVVHSYTNLPKHNSTDLQRLVSAVRLRLDMTIFSNERVVDFVRQSLKSIQNNDEQFESDLNLDGKHPNNKIFFQNLLPCYIWAKLITL
jgi:hypothetical protein